MSSRPSSFEPAFFQEQAVSYLPTTGAVITGGGIGPNWINDGLAVVTHPALGNTFNTQFPRTRFTSAASANNELGVHLPTAIAWRGDAAKRGGFFFSCRFRIHARPDFLIRMFAGLSAGAAVCKNDVVPANSVGFWVDTTDAGNITIVSTDNAAGAHKTPLRNISGTPTTLTLATDFIYEFRIHANPNQGTIVTQIYDVLGDVILRTQNVPDSGTNTPLNSVFMAPQVGLSNAAHAGGGDTALDIMNIYLRPNLRPTPIGAP
jgi:hypothetical protein